MADALFDLEAVLRSKSEQVTVQETNIMKALKARAQVAFYIGAGGGSAVTWLATKSLSKRARPALTLGAGAVCGVWLLTRSLTSSVENILSLEGSLIQREMANIMLKKRHDDPWAHRLVSKHFYREEVYVDSSADKPIVRWRYRNFSGESVSHSQSTTSYSAEGSTQKENRIKNTPAMESKQQVSATGAGTGAGAGAGTGTEDPFDLVLGVTESVHGDHEPEAAVEPSRRQTRKEKRSRRRHRRHHRHEESDDDI